MKTTLLYLNNLLFPLIPETRGFGFKRWMLRLAGARIGNNVRLCSSVKIYGCGDLEVGDNTWIGHQTMIVSSSKILIGCNVDIAPRVYIGTGTHIIDTSSPHVAAFDISNDVIIGNGSWLCANSSILPGVEIGEKCVVAAGAVVTKAFHEDQILIGGVPSQKIKNI